MADPAWLERFQGLTRLGAEVKERLCRDSRVLEVPAGTVIFGPGHVPPEEIEHHQQVGKNCE